MKKRSFWLPSFAAMKALRLTCLLLTCCAMSAQSQENLLVVWNSTIIISEYPHIPDTRKLIYHDEINIRTGGELTPDGDGVLVCRHSGDPGDVEWLPPGSSTPIQSNNNGSFRTIEQVFGSGPTRSQLARVVQTPATAGNEGLWSCNGGNFTRRYVSLYRRGNGRIANVIVSLLSSSFESEEFTLIADTTGGPPTIFSWTRNNGGNLITGVSIEADPDDNQNDRENCLYRSTLQITGFYPGVYEYRASNRATHGDVRHSFTIEGGAPSNLRVVQTGMNKVKLTWIPSPSPSLYRVTDSENNIDIDTKFTNLTIDALPLGDYSFSVAASYSRHFPAGTAGPETITVRGALEPVITLSELTATSVRVSWTQPTFSFLVTRYDVTVRKITLCCSISNRRGPRSQYASDMTELFEDLGEYIDYRAEVTAYFQASFTVSPKIAMAEFTTQGIAPSEVPSNVKILTVTSKAADMSWDDIECGNKNGPNFHYEVDIQQMDGGGEPVRIVYCTMLTVEGLQPFADYTVRVRAVNDAGNGDYTDILMMQTNEDTPGNIVDLNTQLIAFTSVLVTWSPPQEPNGIITVYEVTYQANEDEPISNNITNSFNLTIDSEVNTTLEVGVRAYTTVGPGPVQSSKITLSSIVMNTTVESLTDTSVIVTWDRITDIPGITEYIVYYAPVSLSRKRQDNEQSVTVPSAENSVEISGLESTVEYQYQVTAVAMFDGRQLEGERSPVTESTKLQILEPRDCDTKVVVSISVVVSVLLTIMLNNALLLVGYCIVRIQCNKPLKKISDDNTDVSVKENSAACVPVTFNQQPHDNIYDSIN